MFYAVNNVLPLANQHAKSNYVAVCGVDFTGTVSQTAYNAMSAADKLVYAVGYRGAFGDGSINPPIKLRDETDGTSNTFLIGEVYRKDTDTNYTAWVSGVGGERRPGRWFGLAADDQIACMVRQLKTTGTFAVNGGSFNAFASQHVGGAHFLYSDGTVRFISENGDQTTVSRLGTINDASGIESNLN